MEEKQTNEEYAEAELEGGNLIYWWVCGECRCIIKQGAYECPVCKRRIRW